MRWVVISLVLMNLALFGYLMTQGKPTAPGLELVNADVPKGAKRIDLIEEGGKPQKKKNKPPEVEPDQVCWVVGPNRDEMESKHLMARMQAMDIQARLESKAVIIKTEYWVYVPPLASKKQALIKLKELQRRKIDSFVITDGELENGISLGLFSKKESVERLMARLRQKKIEAEMQEMERTRDQYWVVAPILTGFVLDQNTRNRLSDGKVLNWQQLRCDSPLPGS